MTEMYEGDLCAEKILALCMRKMLQRLRRAIERMVKRNKIPHEKYARGVAGETSDVGGSFSGSCFIRL
jgi:hypothetical protein